MIINRTCNPVAIPSDLKAVARWVCWRADRKPDGRIDKLPLDKNNPNRKVNSLENCEKWETVSKRIFQEPGLGLGFYPDSDHTGLVGIDLDHVFRDQIIRLDALDIVKSLDSYTEYSPSGTGLHVWIRSSFYPSNHNGKVMEIKSKGNSYLTVTGNVFGEKKPIADRTGVLMGLLEKYFQKEKEKPQGEKEKRIFLPSDDTDTLRKLWSNPARARLWDGDLSDYNGDHSRGDLALCNFIFWCSNCDLEAVDRLFRRSGLMRDKWDEIHYSDGRTYGQMTIERVSRGAQ